MFLCPLCSSQTRFCRALKQKPSRDEEKHSKISPSLTSSTAIKSRNGTTWIWGVEGYKKFLVLCNAQQPHRGAQTATRSCQIFHSWMQCQGGWGPQQTRGKTLETSQKPNLDLHLKAALIPPGKGGMQTGITVSAQHISLHAVKLMRAIFRL